MVVMIYLKKKKKSMTTGLDFLCGHNIYTEIALGNAE